MSENKNNNSDNPMQPPRGQRFGNNKIKVGEKPKEFKKSLGKLISYSKMYVPMIIVALIFIIISSVFSLIGPNKLSEITNIVTSGMMTEINLKEVYKIGIFLSTIYGLSLFFGYGQGFILSTVAQRITKRLRTDIFNKINKLPFSYFDSKSYGDTLSRVTNDVDAIGNTLNQSLSTLSSGIIMFCGSLLMMFLTNWIMALSGLLSVVLGFVLMTLLISKSQKYFVKQQRELGKINGHIEETYSGQSIIKAYNGEGYVKDVFSETNNELYKCAWKSQFISGLMMPIMIFIGNLGYVVVCIIGAVLASKGTISFGVIVAFMVYIKLFTQPLSQLAQAATTLQSTAAASERVFEFLEEEELSDESEKNMELNNIQGNVTFSNVNFGYTSDKIIIKDFSAIVKAGQKVAIVGPTGAGKTTIVNLLMRFYELNSGEIFIDGISINNLKRENVHNLFGMVLQDTWIFEGTIKENIIYNKLGISDEEVIEACKAVGIHSFIKTLPNGYDTVLNDKASLSAGQKQLITIARAMIQNSPLLILDEATSSVDTRTEILIQSAMDKLAVGRTSFIIAHRLSTIKNADVILVMKDGNIIESGTHNELLERNGFYADLYNSQFENAS